MSSPVEISCEFCGKEFVTRGTTLILCNCPKSLQAELEAKEKRKQQSREELSFREIRERNKRPIRK